MKRLFNDPWETYTEDGNNLHDSVRELLRPIVDKYMADGFSIRDVENVMHGAMSEIVAYSVLTRNAKKARELRGLMR